MHCESAEQPRSINDVIHYECMIDIFFAVFIVFSRYGKFLEFFGKNSGKFPTFIFPEKLQP